MLRSMTGYGRSKCEFDSREYTVEIKSVNNRYSDISIKLPRSISFMEDNIKKEKKFNLKNITPNARLLGMNVDALMAGNKLTEDYIHPQDRARVIQNAKNVLKSGGSDYEDEYRIVDDYGNVDGFVPRTVSHRQGILLIRLSSL